MSRAKTAYDLACERVIISKYGDQCEKERKETERIERERLGSLPDFVVAWEMKQKNSGKIEEEVMSEEPTRIYSQEEIRKHREKKNQIAKENEPIEPIVEIEENKETIEVIEAEDINEENKEIEENINVPEVHWYGHFTSYGGFSRQNRAFVFGLSNRGVRVKIDMQPISVDVNNATVKELENLARLDINPKATKIYAATMPLEMCHDGKKIIYTMMESESLQKHYVEKVNLFDEVWVPTHFAQKQFKKYGVNRPIYVMPLGVDTERYTPIKKINPATLNFDLNKFVFLSVFKWGYRKGFDILLKAYFDEFSSDDNISLLLVTRCESDNNPNRISDDVSNIRAGIDKSDEQLPHLSICTKKIPEKDLTKIYQMSDAFILISLGEGFCTLPNAQIKTPNGVRNISEISIGDSVFSHRGLSRKVVKTFKRKYSGKMIRIKSIGRSNQTIQLTPNHNVLVFRPDNISSTTRLKSLNLARYSEDLDNIVFKKRDSLIGVTKYDKIGLEWIRSDKIKKGDYLFYPKINYLNNIESYYKDMKIDMSKIDQFKNRFIIENNCIYKKMRNQYGTITKGKRLFDNVSIDVSKDLLKLMGYFIAEGCCSKGRVIFSFNSNESEYHEEVIILMKKIFGDINYGKYFSKNKNSCVISFYSVVAITLFESLFGKGARNKEIPNFIFNIDNSLKIELLHGLFNGDGYYKKGQVIQLTTASVNLANNVFDLLFSIGIKSSIKSRIMRNGYGLGRTYYSVVITSAKDSNSLFDHFEDYKNKVEIKKSCKKIILGENFELIKVSKIENIQYNGYVYNIGVDVDNSYICENIAVHNCLPYLEAAACGLPVIGSNCSAQTDYLTKENSYLVDPDEMVTVKTNGALSKLAKHCGFYEGQVFPNFGATGIKKTRELMREVFENYDEALKKSQKLTDLVHNEFSWDMAVEKVLKRIKEIGE